MLPKVNCVNCGELDYLLFSTPDLISNHLRWKGKWEEHLLMISRAFYYGVESPLVLDVGANLGAYSIPVAKDVQRLNGSVIGFEPQRIIYYQLCGNIFLNSLDNYRAFNQAVGDVDGFVEVPEVDYGTNRNIGAFSLDGEYRRFNGIDASVKSKTTKVPMIRLDDLEVEKSPSLIKIDVEGFEINVLKGAKDFLSRHRFPPVLFEAWNFDWFAEGRKELMACFLELGYKVIHLGAADYIAQHPDFPVLVEFAQTGSNSFKVYRVR